MEDTKHPTATELPEHLEQPGQAKFSAILNGMGNGAMVGGATYIGLPKLWQLLTKHEISAAAREKNAFFATVAGAALGTWYGIYEAKHLENYRETIGQEITRLNKKVDALEARPTSHQEKVAQQRELADELAR